MRFADGTLATWLSNGTTFYYADYDATPFTDEGNWNSGFRYFPMDVNGDGKGDMVMRYADGTIAIWGQ